MDKPKARTVNASSHYLLDSGFASELRAFGISAQVIDSLTVAMRNMTNRMDVKGYDYARGMRQALLDYGISGVKQQTSCMISCMRMWRGEEARKHKLVLRKWIR